MNYAAAKHERYPFKEKRIAEAMTLHVRHIVRQFHPMVGGLEDTVANLAIALKETQGIDSSIVTLNRGFREPSVRLKAHDNFHGIPLMRIPYRGSTRYPLAPSVLGALQGADIVHVHAIDFFFDFLALTRPVHRKPLVASTHGGFFHTDFASKLKKIYFNNATRLSATAYQRIFGSSENDAEVFSQIAPRQTMIVENGVNIKKWHNAASQTLQPTMLYIGRFSQNKALPDLINIIAQLGAPWRLLIAGSDSDLTAAELTNIAAQNGVADHVEVFASPDNEQINALASRASYIASASQFEGFGLSIIEGMSAGLIPLVNTIPPFAKLVRQTGCGLCLPMADARDAAGAISAFHSKMGGYEAHRNRAIASSSAYGWDAVAKKFADQYRALDGTKH